MPKVVDEMALNESLTATVEEVRGLKYVRIRPHQPVAYFQAQGAVILHPGSLAGLRELLERNGLWPTS